jgi:hypothetical protein
MNFTSDDIQRYMNRTFDIDCPRMVLKRNIKTPDRIYEGPGNIQLTPEGHLVFKLYDQGAPLPPASAFTALLEDTGVKSGQIIPRDEYFSLEATATNGSIWRGESVLPQFAHGVTGAQIISASLHEIVNVIVNPQQKRSKPRLKLIFSRDYDFPGNTLTQTKTSVGGVEVGASGDWRSAAFRAAGLSFHLSKVHNTAQLSVNAEDAWPTNLDSRICETLQFVFFNPVVWVIRIISENQGEITTLRSFPRHGTNGISYPPIGNNRPSAAMTVWHLFEKYFEYILTHPTGEWHPISNKVHDVIVGGESSFEASLLALSVAVEGALKAGLPQLAARSSSVVGQIDHALDLISQSDLEESFKKRMEGSLNGMRNSRSIDKLLYLQNEGLIREDLVGAWKRLRNPSVHSDGLAPGAIEKQFRDYQSALSLFHEIIFLAIGYTGPYTDYSVAGWPEREFAQGIKPQS